jgi:prolyl-tRNA synthetase
MNALGVAEHDFEMADAETVKRVTHAEVGFAGPIGLDKEVELLVDSRVLEMKNFVIGANETDRHLINANYGRDFEGQVIDDLLLVRVGDACPKCGKPLVMDRGIEVGNIFQLGVKYSSALSATYLDQNGKSQLIWMGSYGVGVSRSVASIIEQNYDDFGIVWPAVVAPYHVVVMPVNVKNDDQRQLAEEIYEELKAMGVEVILDDRKERPGVKFKDAELIGFPIRIAVGRGAADRKVEFVLRKDVKNKEEMDAADVAARVKAELAAQNVIL